MCTITPVNHQGATPFPYVRNHQAAFLLLMQINGLQSVADPKES
jgi:hypothetical protein